VIAACLPGATFYLLALCDPLIRYYEAIQVLDFVTGDLVVAGSRLPYTVRVPKPPRSVQRK
jgi:hypothetical protein